MGLLTSFGKHVKGLLGDDAFFDRLAQAQAFANGNPATAARIGADIRRRKQRPEPPGPSALSIPGQGQAQPGNYPRLQVAPFDFGPDFDPRKPLSRPSMWWGADA
jgi:hypothetical protein